MRAITRARRYVDLKMHAFKMREEDRARLGDICAAEGKTLILFATL